MQSFVKKMVWYPPAETKISLSAILSAFTLQPRDFKNDLRCYLNVNHCILGESARALLFKLLEALKKHDDDKRDEVLIPGYTCYSVAAAIAKAGLKITTYDLDPATLYPDLDSFECAVSEKTLAVVTQHLFGILTPISDVKKIAHRYNAYLIEDAAQAFGNGDDGKVPGAMGDFGLFSFGRGKPLPIGSGGALVSKSHSEILDEINLVDSPEKGYRQVLLSVATQIVSKPAFYWIAELLPLGLGKTVFNPDFHVAAMPNALEKISVNALPNIDQLNWHRKRLSGVYSEHLKKKYQIENIDNVTSMIRFPVMLPNIALTKDLNRLGVRKMYPKAITEENAIRPHLKQIKMPTPGSVEISKRLFTLPTHMGIDDTVARRIAVIVQKTLGQD